MNFRLELGKSSSGSYAWALRMCRRWPTYNEVIEEGMAIHSITFTENDFRKVQPILSTVYGWKQATIYKDGLPVPSYAFMEFLWNTIDGHSQDERLMREIFGVTSVIEGEIVPDARKRLPSGRA